MGVLKARGYDAPLKEYIQVSASTVPQVPQEAQACQLLQVSTNVTHH